MAVERQDKRHQPVDGKIAESNYSEFILCDGSRCYRRHYRSRACSIVTMFVLCFSFHSSCLPSCPETLQNERLPTPLFLMVIGVTLGLPGTYCMDRSDQSFFYQCYYVIRDVLLSGVDMVYCCLVWSLPVASAFGLPVVGWLWSLSVTRPLPFMPFILIRNKMSEPRSFSCLSILFCSSNVPYPPAPGRERPFCLSVEVRKEICHDV